MKPKRLQAVLLLGVAAFFATSNTSANAQNIALLPQGNFQQVDAAGAPVGWDLWSRDGTTLASDGANRWIQLRDGAVMHQVVRLDPAWTSISMSARLKLSGYQKGPEPHHGPRIGVRFVDNANAQVGDYPPSLSLTGDSDWVTKEVSFPIPAGATQLQIQPGLWGSKGLLEVDDIVVKASAIATTPAVPSVAAVDAPWPKSAKVPWGSEPVEVQSSKRSRVSLNGAWKFSPALSVRGEANAAPAKGWGYIQVPGNWRRNQEIYEQGKGPQWQGFDGRKLAGAWYERRFTVPADWGNSHISIDFQRISTDATFWVNDKPAGVINWPEGELDITGLVKPGEEATLRAFVVATIDEGEAIVMMGPAPGQNWTVKKEVIAAGIVGNVTLQRRPVGAYVSDVFVQPSTRKKQLGVDFEVSGATQEGPVQLVASLIDENGKEEKRFTETVNVKAVPTQRVQVSWPWENPRLWDVDQPNLYVLRLSAKGAGIDDEPAQRFGFRETWIQGRDIFLNGTPFRIRPTLLGSGDAGTGSNSVAEARATGYNFGELWPGGIEERSHDARFTEWYDLADRGGFPISGIMPHMGWMGGGMNAPHKVAAYKAQVERIARRYRNHPSVIFWGNSGNMIGGTLDPAYVGNREASRRFETQKQTMSSRAHPIADTGVALIKAADPTRPVFVHNGGLVGDIYTLNNYLNFIPLQEREEWLSHYVQHGDMPLMYVEFGTPVSLSLARGRDGFLKAMAGEMFLSEYVAIYLGEEAYKLEPAAYRKRTTELFKQDQTYSWHLGMKERDFAPAWLKLQDLFIRNTWRSWRTMGMTGGMIPWDAGYVRLDGKWTPAGEAMRANNSDTLAWIAGGANQGDIAAFTAKDHAYFAGETIGKQIALLNDSRKPQPYSLRWSATVDGKSIGSDRSSGSLAVGETLLVPFAFAAPASAGKVDGSITLEATIGDATHTDRFDFRVWPRAAASQASVTAFDPEGKTSEMLRKLGYTVANWSGQPSDQLLVIGRNALKSDLEMPGDLKAFVEAGGRVLLSGQDPHWLREKLGVRVSYHQSRRAWKVGESPAVGELDEVDLRDWRGHGTLLNPRPDYLNGTGPDLRWAKTHYPYAGWRWGNRGTVASAAIEKPHRAGWRPLLECEFDLAYSPLMELDFGRGKVIWSQLDLEDHAGLDPAAQQLARQVVDYSAKAALAPRVPVTYLGGESGRTLLKSLGLQFHSAEALPASGLVVVGADSIVSDAQLETFAQGGGRVLFLPRRDAKGAAGLQLEQRAEFIGSLQPPDWAEAAGLSASDLRWRNAHSAWLATPGNGWQVGADGLLARRAVGKGVLLWSQIDPTWLPADEKTYFRLTRWRQTRALSQLLANLGAAFEFDARIFAPSSPEEEPIVALAGEWRARLIQRFDTAPSPDKGPPDKGISADAMRALAVDFDDSDWQVVPARAMETFGGKWADAEGEAVLRKTIDVPAALQGKELKLSLGTIDDHDDTYFNGVRLGGHGAEDPKAYAVEREYTIPAELVKPGKNVIAIRVWDKFGAGGFTSSDPKKLHLKSVEAWVKPADMYHPDYRDEFETSDEPYRYYNW